MDTYKDAIRVAAGKIGFAELKSHQVDVILALVTGNDVFAVLPTRAMGKVCAMRASRFYLTVYWDYNKETIL